MHFWNKQDIYRLLEETGVSFQATEHPAVFNMAELSRIQIPHPEADAKNLFVRDDKKSKYYLISVLGEKRMDLKEFRRIHHTRPLSFASLRGIASKAGACSGLRHAPGLLNDETREIPLFLDSDFHRAPGLIGVHPNDNTATVLLRTDDLVSLLKNAGHPVEWADL